ncbi:hypothetical protein AAFF_G00287910, partial [Aldrovandia affinis]
MNGWEALERSLDMCVPEEVPGELQRKRHGVPSLQGAGLSILDGLTGGADPARVEGGGPRSGELGRGPPCPSGCRLKVLPICRPLGSPATSFCSDVTLVILRSMSGSAGSVAVTSAGAGPSSGGVGSAETTPSVVTLAILISESGSVLLSAEEESFRSESSSSSITMGSPAPLAVAVEAG